MIHVKVLGAKNLPIEEKDGWKSQIYCFSTSSGHYYYHSFKNNKNTENPKWEGEFSAELFRVSTLSFFIYGFRIGSKRNFLGRVDISIPILFENRGSQIISTPNSYFSLVFPIKSCQSSNASLFLSFSYSPKIYNPIRLNKILKPIIHIWATFDPPNNSQNVEIELLQAYTTKDAKGHNQHGFYYDFNSLTSWEPVGYSSNTNYILVSNCRTQIHSLLPHRIYEKYEFFILNDINYSGKVSLNFVAEHRDKKKYFKRESYYEPKKDNQIGVIQSFNVICKPNNKYCVPFYLYCDKKHGHKDLQFNQFTSINYERVADSNGNGTNDIQFHKEIIEKAKRFIPEWNNVDFTRTNCAPYSQPVSLMKIFNDLDLQRNTELKIYVGGLTKTTYTDTQFLDYWIPEFIVYDKSNNTRCPEIPKELKTKPNIVIADKNESIFGFDWHSYVKLNLDQIGKEKVIVFIVYCPAEMETAKPDGFYLISQMDGAKESLLFRCPIYPESNQTHFEIFFRFECINDEWNLVPMQYCFKKSKKMKTFLDTLFINNWDLPNKEAYKLHSPGFESSSSS